MSSTPVTGRRHVRVSTIVWGAILVGAAVFAVVATRGGALDAASVLWTVVGFGAVLILSAVVGAIVRAVRRDGTPQAATTQPATLETQAAETQSTAELHPPIG
jgi:predicted phage tail protein